MSAVAMKLPHDERGDGPAVVLLHAGIADRHMWDEHLEPLAATGHRVVAMDLPGFGDAGLEREPVAHWLDVVETMDALGIERGALVGSSFGGAVALRVAALHPARTTSLALFSAPAIPEPDPSPELLAVWEAEDAAIAAGDVEKAVEEVVAAWVRPEAPGEVRDRIAAMQRGNYERHATERGLEQAPDPLEEDPDLVRAIDCPALVAAGELDLVDFRDAVPALAARLPRASTATIPGCGHLAPLEAPTQFRELVADHLKRSAA